MAWSGAVRQDWARNCRHGVVRRGMAWLFGAWHCRQGEDRLGDQWHGIAGKAGKARWGEDGHGETGQGKAGLAGQAWHGLT